MQLNTNYTDTPPAREEIDAMTGPVLLEFGSPGCGYCRAVQPLLAKATENTPDITHIKVADGSGRRLGRSFQVRLWPTLIFMRDGKEISRLVRPESVEVIREGLEVTIDQT